MKEIFLNVMNRAFKADPNAIHCLIVNRVPCNMELANDPTIIVEGSRVLEGLNPQVGLLGILNGILEEGGSDLLLTAKFTDENPRRIVGFELRAKEDFK
jgi:hypothetical protein